MYRSFLSGYSIRFLIFFLSLLLATFGLLCSHKARLLRSLCTCSGSHLQVVSLAGSGKRHSRRCGRGACEVSKGLWKTLDRLVSIHTWECGSENCRSVWPFLTLDLRDSGYRMRGGALLVMQWNGLAICQL